MLYGNDSISHYTKSNVTVWMTMALQAGVLNTGGFMACHRFVSHVTGFATYFGYEVSRHSGLKAFGMLSVPLFFLFGSMISGELVDIRLKHQEKPRYYISFGLIFFLISAIYWAGFFDFFGSFGEPVVQFHDYILLMFLCLVCGIQNGTITMVSKSVVRTTHLTGITTDLGLGLVRYLHRKKLPSFNDDERRAIWMRIGIIFFFGLGSVIGGFGFAAWGYGGFVIPLITSGSLFVTMLYYQVYKPRKI